MRGHSTNRRICAIHRTTLRSSRRSVRKSGRRRNRIDRDLARAMTFEASADNETALLSRYAICLPMCCGRLTSAPVARHTFEFHGVKPRRPPCSSGAGRRVLFMRTKHLAQAVPFPLQRKNGRNPDGPHRSVDFGVRPVLRSRTPDSANTLRPRVSSWLLPKADLKPDERESVTANRSPMCLDFRHSERLAP